MRKGFIICSCGQHFMFETTQDTIQCPACTKEFSAIEHGEDDTPMPIPLVDPPKPPAEGGEEDGTGTE